MAIAPGKQLGRLEILDPIHAGGIGEFFRALDTRTGQDVAVKILPLENGRPFKFEQAHHTTASLKHPNILGIRGLRSKVGMSYVITDPVEGETLHSILRRGPLSIRRLIGIAAQTAGALAAGQAVGVMHGDLRPEDILVDDKDNVKLLDLGLATPHRPELETTAYMSPEQLRGEPVDGRADVFSLGTILYEMATGRPAFQGRTPQALRQAILEQTPDQPPAHIPPPLLDLISRCLDRDPAGRFQSAAEVSAALQNCASSPELALLPEPQAPGGTKSALERLRDRGRIWIQPATAALKQQNRFWIPAALAAILLLLLGDFAIRARTSRPEVPRFERLTFRQGLIVRARLTADGKNVIYTARFEDSPQATYLAALGSTDARDLNLPVGSSVAAVSSKGDLAVRLKDGVLLRQPLSGGGQLRQEAEGVFDADWSPDGASLAIARASGRANFSVEYPIGKILYESTQPVDLVRVSPNGERIAFTAYEGSQRRLWFADRSGSRKMLTNLSLGEATRTLCWSADSREIWFSSVLPRERGVIQAVGINGSKRKVNWMPEAYLDDVSRDGRAVVEVFRAWSGILFRGPGKDSDKDLSWLGETLNVRLSRDGLRTFFTEYGGMDGAAFKVYRRGTDEPSAAFVGDGRIVAASPDGAWVTVSRGNPNPKFYLLNTSSGKEQSIVLPGLESQSGAVVGWMPGGDRLVWGKAEGKNPQYFLWAANGTLKPVSPEGAPLGVASEDGSRVIAAGPDRKWYVFSATGGAPTLAPGLQGGDNVLRWAQDGGSVYAAVLAAGSRKFAIVHVNIANGARTVVKEIEAPIQADSIIPQAITPDGRSVAYTYYRAQSNLYLAEGLK